MITDTRTHTHTHTFLDVILSILYYACQVFISNEFADHLREQCHPLLMFITVWLLMARLEVLVLPGDHDRVIGKLCLSISSLVIGR